MPRWTEGSFAECRRPPSTVGSRRTQPQMAPVNDLESNCIEVDVETTQPSPRMRSRPQGNMAATEDNKNMKIHDVAIRA